MKKASEKSYKSCKFYEPDIPYAIGLCKNKKNKKAICEKEFCPKLPTTKKNEKLLVEAFSPFPTQIVCSPTQAKVYKKFFKDSSTTKKEDR